jgi:ATP-binding protein involved in chromosome partitioning
VEEKESSNTTWTIEKFNVDFSCPVNEFGGIDCAKCERFFDCRSPKKWEIYNMGRMGLVKDKMGKIKHKIVIVGGKGGVGKTTVSVNLSMDLALRGYRVSILDSDFDGSCVPKMLGTTGEKLKIGNKGVIPVEGPLGIQVISMANVITRDEIVTWYTDLRRSATEEFLSHVDYGERDFLVVDLPPGTSADSVNTMEFIPDIDGAVVVTIPSTVSQGIALKAALLCKKADVKILGVVENMSGHVCRSCGHKNDILTRGGGENLAEQIEAPFLGRIPLDGSLGRAADEGVPFVKAYPESVAAKAAKVIINQVLDRIGVGEIEE